MIKDFEQFMKTSMTIMRSVGCDVDNAAVILPIKVAAILFKNLLKMFSSKNDNVELVEFSGFAFLKLIMDKF